MAHVKARRWSAEQSDGDEIYLFAIEHTIARARTTFQDVEIVESAAYGKMLLLDGLVQSAEADEYLYHEALVHPGMLAHADPKDVLIIGGGEGATLREVLRHKTVRKATMVDIDGELIELCKKHLGEWHKGAFDDPRAEIVIGDGRAYLETSEQTFDIVICDITDFLDHGPAMRLYTKEFYALVKKRLNPGGVLIVQAMELAATDWEEHSTLRRTIATAFTNVQTYQIFVPSFIFTWGFIVASDNLDPENQTEAEVDLQIASKLGGKLKALDGRVHRGLFALSKDLRYKIRDEGLILDDANIATWGDE